MPLTQAPYAIKAVQQKATDEDVKLFPKKMTPTLWEKAQSTWYAEKKRKYNLVVWV